MNNNTFARFPSLLVSALIVGVVSVLQYLLVHVGSFGLPDLYAPLAALIISTLIKLVQEYEPVQDATPRGFESNIDSYIKRVLVG